MDPVEHRAAERYATLGTDAQRAVDELFEFATREVEATLSTQDSIWPRAYLSGLAARLNGSDAAVDMDSPMLVVMGYRSGVDDMARILDDA